MFGKRLAIERRRLGLSQAELAPHLGIGRSALAMIETDRAPLDVAHLIDLAEKISLDPIFVLTGERSRVAASKLMDWDLISAIQTGIQSWCAAHKIVLPPEKNVLIVKILYERFASSDEDLREGVAEVLRLVA